MPLKNIRPPREPVLKFIFSILFFLLFENVCLGGKWTMMFYMAADNDLYSQALIDINELQNISGLPGIDILVQLDSRSGAFRYKVLPQGTSTLASLGQSNSGSPQALADFGSWAVKTYPAQKYLLVLWDHGNGWSKQGKYIGLDGSDYLSVADGELKGALAKISSAAGQPLDVVVFDACSMQMAEVLMELKGLCRYAVGSEAPFPVEGMPYAVAWENIDGNTPAESLATRLVRSCSTFNDLGYDVTCSAVDISILSAASQTLNSLVGQLRLLPVSAYVPSAPDSVSVVHFPSASYDLPGMLGFIGNRTPDPEKTAVLNAGREFSNSVLVQTVTGSKYQSAQGLAVWYPAGKINFESGIEAYHNLNWSVLSGWDKILHQLIVQQDSTAPVPQNVDLEKGPGGISKLSWEIGYDPAGIELYQIRQSQNLTTDFSDQGGGADSANWEKTGFNIIPWAAGDTAYFSVDGQMTGKNTIRFDSSGSIGFTVEGVWGVLILESVEESSLKWDTLGTWNFYSEGPLKYLSAKVKTSLSRIRISWHPLSWGSSVFIDDIKACRPDTAKAVETASSFVALYNLSCKSGAAGFYQIRSVDSLENISPWSEAVFVQPAAGLVRAWPNPFSNKAFLLFSSSNEKMQGVSIFNILGQFVDRMSLQKIESEGGVTENIYSWEPKASIAAGVYIARLDLDTGTRTVKMILIR